MKTILIVDDCENFREVAAEVLVDAGYIVIVAKSITDAHLKLQENSNIDLIVSNEVLQLDETELDGDDNSALVGVNGAVEFSGLAPVVLISNKLTESSPNEELVLAAANLQKPFKPNCLISTVEKVLNKSKLKELEA